MQVSVVTCVHNPRMDTLRRVWAALRDQSVCQDQWEYILVDNASDVAFSNQLRESALPGARCVREDRLGLTQARLRGIAEAKGEIVVFVDDDCLLDSDYLGQVLKIFDEHSFLGAVGGCGRAEYERPPPDWMTPSLRTFLLDMRPDPSGHSLVYARVHKHWGAWFPIGAGMAIRRTLALHYAKSISNDPIALGFDRTGTGLSGGGDLDMGISVMEQGYAIGTSRDLRFVHVVPAFRLELAYMVRLLYMSQYSTVQLMICRGWVKPVPAAPPPSFWKRFKKRLSISLRRPPPEDLCWQAYSRGSRDGLSGVPPDPEFCA